MAERIQWRVLVEGNRSEFLQKNAKNDSQSSMKNRYEQDKSKKRNGLVREIQSCAYTKENRGIPLFETRICVSRPNTSPFYTDPRNSVRDQDSGSLTADFF